MVVANEDEEDVILADWNEREEAEAVEAKRSCDAAFFFVR